jgi:hypothetical protein
MKILARENCICVHCCFINPCQSGHLDSGNVPLNLASSSPQSSISQSPSSAGTTAVMTVTLLWSLELSFYFSVIIPATKLAIIYSASSSASNTSPIPTPIQNRYSTQKSFKTYEPILAYAINGGLVLISQSFQF